MSKNDLSLFNELSRENYDVTELDDGADITGIRIIRLNSALFFFEHTNIWLESNVR